MSKNETHQTISLADLKRFVRKTEKEAYGPKYTDEEMRGVLAVCRKIKEQFYAKKN
jgi:hypothetical protein